MKPITIGQLASQAGVGRETIRYYERVGLISDPHRGASGYRQYAPDAVRRVRFIRRAKTYGFSLREIRELLHIRAGAQPTRAGIRTQAKRKIADIEARVVGLEQMKAALTQLVHQCRGKGAISNCPILDALDHGDPILGDDSQGPGTGR